MTLHLEDIHVTVQDGPDELTILDGVDLDVGPGELVAITGASGSGKSTLVAVAGLLRRPDRGIVAISGDDLTDARNRHRTTVRRERIGLIFQASNLLPSLTAIEQLELVAHSMAASPPPTASRPATSSTQWAWMTAGITGPVSSPAVNASASPSPVP